MSFVSLVLVCHRSSSYVGRAIERFRWEARTLGVRQEVVVVDHSEDPEEVQALRAAAPDTLIVQTNKGYAAGVNRGIGEAQGDILLVGNPDVELEAGALEALLAGLETYPIVGPQFKLGSLLFPPMEPQLPGAELLRWLANISLRLRRKAMFQESLRAVRVWEASEPVRMPFLRGALLAFHRETFTRLGPWEEDYFLYFEETDWLLRATRRGLACALVPAARAQHRWGASAVPSAHAAFMVSSRRLYYRRNFGCYGRLVASLPLLCAEFPPEPVPDSLGPQEEVWWLVSPNPHGIPAFGVKGSGVFPESIAGQSFSFDRHPRTFLVAALKADGELEGPWRWDA